ncbi:MAG: SRPBCC family protein [Phenylobacterium sp.]|uniref:SRPBCC family protein n=1 Tax=Phenylobacterium sp. TaxID=1871053 RepID=UPI00271B1EB6|nr:SRPBCC family protein [Phenylobacterium sp.]MDO8409808.1 SRPBCC family protein [Phenylobacterium sp.]
MSDLATLDAYGALIEPATLKIQRLLPGPIERVWDYLTQTELRRRWLASGDMPAQTGETFELVWRNDELTDPPGARPEGFSDEHRMASQVVAMEPPRRLVITWGVQSEVEFGLEPRGVDVLLSVIHRRLPDRESLLNVSAGWHAHIDVLAADLTGGKAKPHWDNWVRLRSEYDARLPA